MELGPLLFEQKVKLDSSGRIEILIVGSQNEDSEEEDSDSQDDSDQESNKKKKFLP